ncbi:Ubiquinol-cytochrome c chaperone/UPF0174 [Trinorchestia longiramus]|nr:Ubiquinol-cytochrome c chaperone/UPF0174 [Trinorchestia longiramus]
MHIPAPELHIPENSSSNSCVDSRPLLYRTTSTSPQPPAGGVGSSLPQLTRSGYDLYSEISKNTDVLHFFKILSLEDTFFSWLLVMQLQVWLVSARLMAEGDEGKVARNALINAMWEDTQAKLVDLGIGSNRTDRYREMEIHSRLYVDTPTVRRVQGGSAAGGGGQEALQVTGVSRLGATTSGGRK